MTYPFKLRKRIPETQATTCTGGAFNPKCRGLVSPDDPNNELCRKCLIKHIRTVESIFYDALNELAKYRKAATS